jgi:anti-anti-sigma regulatory factor
MAGTRPIWARRFGGFAWLVPSGDLLRADDLVRALVANRAPFVLLDLRAIKLIGPGALRALFAEAREARAAGRKVFVMPGPAIREALTQRGTGLELIDGLSPHTPVDGWRPHRPARRSELVDLLVGATPSV